MNEWIFAIKEVVRNEETGETVLKPKCLGELIRCKECANSRPWYGDRRLCDLWSDTVVGVWDDGYCNYGHRKGEESPWLKMELKKE